MEWDGARFVPVEPAGAGEGAGADRGYGYQVWLRRGDSYYASGMFGQDCVVLPRQDAVVAITAGIPRGPPPGAAAPSRAQKDKPV